MKKIRKPVWDLIAADYKSGITSFLVLANKYNLSKAGVRKILIRDGLYSIKAIGRPRYTIWDQLGAEYTEGKVDDLARKYGVTLSGAKKALKRDGLHKPLNVGAQPGHISATFGKSKYTVDTTVFELPLADEAAYWLGFLTADGCVGSQSKRANVQRITCLELKASDELHIHKFAKFLNTSFPIKYNKPRESMPINGKTVKNTGSYSIQICSHDLADKLLFHNIFPKKSLKEVAPNHLKDNIHFWRGVVDGDGYLSNKTRNPDKPDRVSMGLVGSKELVTQFLEFVGNTHTKTGKSRLEEDPNRNGLCKCAFTGINAIPIIERLYRDAPISLDRKQEIANNILRDNDKSTTTFS